MKTESSRPTLTARDRTTGQHRSWARALSDVWAGVASPEALELQVIWPIAASDVVVKNTNTIG